MEKYTTPKLQIVDLKSVDILTSSSGIILPEVPISGGGIELPEVPISGGKLPSF